MALAHAPPDLPPALAAALACPGCHGDLTGAPEQLRCAACGAVYAVRAGTPHFLDLASYDGEIRAFEQLGGTGLLSKQTAASGGLRGLALRHPWLLGPPIARDPEGPARWRRLASWLAERPGLAVNLGAQGQRPVAGMVTLDAEPGEGIDLVADAHRLPFADASLTLVTSTSLFEHLRRPQQAAAELLRCLRPGGSVYLEVPWMYELHGCPMDFQRWTQAGLRELLGDFEHLDEGVLGGPGSVAARMLRGLVFSLTPGRRLRYLARTAATWGLWWMKYLDAWIPAARRAPFAQGYWIWARRPPA